MREKDLMEAAIRATKRVRELNRERDQALRDRQTAYAKAFQDGQTQQAIADACDVSVKTVQADLKAAGVKREI